MVKFIYDHGPGTNAGNEQTEFAETEVNDPASPIYRWSAGLWKESLRNRQKGNNLAKVIDYYPLTLKSLAPWVLDHLVVKLLKAMVTKAVIWVGISGRGKTPVMSILSMLWSLYHIRRDKREGVLVPSCKPRIKE